jgi:dipeptidyl aminopeptidase/acylaminoacyl peptidase
VEPIWVPGSQKFWFFSEHGGRTLLSADLEHQAIEPALDLERLAAPWQAATGTRLDPLDLPFSSLEFMSPKRVRIPFAETYYEVDIEAYEVRPVPLHLQEALDRARPRPVRPPVMDGYLSFEELPSPTGTWMLTEDGDDLALRSLRDDRRQPLTKDGQPGFGWRLGHAWWSPDGQQVLARRVDYRELPPVALLHYLKDIEEIELVHPYVKAESAPPPTAHALIDVPSGTTLPILQELAPGARTELLGWRGNEVFVHAFDAEATQQTVYAVDRRSGDARVVLSEPLSLSGAMSYRRAWARTSAFQRELDGGSAFLWPSDRDGWNHWYLYSLDGNPIRRLTSGEFDVEECVHVDETAGQMYFMAHADTGRPFDTHLCVVGLDGTSQARLTSQPGDHQVQISADGDHFVDTWSTVSVPPRTVVRDTDGKEILEVRSADPGRMDGLDWAAPNEFTAISGDGETELHGVLYLPPGFRPEKKYPVVDVIYGGPQLTVRPTTFDQSAFSGSENGRRVHRGVQAQALAQLGFVTFVVDNRGTPGRGTAYHEVVRGRMGQHEIPDHVSVLRQLADRYPWIDVERAGIVGHSWGGYLTLRAMLTAPETYRVGCASAPVPDHYDHQGHLAHMIMGLPSQNPDGYSAGSCLPLAGQLTGKLLITHGTSDLGATFSATMKMVDAFVKAGRPVDLFVYPEGTHNPEGHLARYQDGLLARYLVKHLQPQGVVADDISLGA